MFFTLFRFSPHAGGGGGGAPKGLVHSLLMPCCTVDPQKSDFSKLVVLILSSHNMAIQRM